MKSVFFSPGDGIRMSTVVVCLAEQTSTASWRLSPDPGIADLPLTTSARIGGRGDLQRLETYNKTKIHQSDPIKLDNYQENKHAYLNN